MGNRRIEGRAALVAAEEGQKVVLCKYQDPVWEACEGLTLEEAYEVAAEDPWLLYAVGSTDDL